MRKAMHDEDAGKPAAMYHTEKDGHTVAGLADDPASKSLAFRLSAITHSRAIHLLLPESLMLYYVPA